MVYRIVALATLGISIVAQTRTDDQFFLQRLGREADLFERSAYRVMGLETLTQTVPHGVRIGRGMRGVETRLPGFTREIVSEYSFVSLDEPGGTLREVRNVLRIDGQTWTKRTMSLEQLAREMAGRDDKGKRRQLERFEEFGLEGFVTDLGQLILLFARSGATRYEVRYEKDDGIGHSVYTYQQLDGKEAFTIYGEGKEPTRQRLKGRIFFQKGDGAPARISLESDRTVDGVPLRDISTVEYERSIFGFLLPARIVHQQFIGTMLYVTDVYSYSSFREILAAPHRR